MFDGKLQRALTSGLSFGLTSGIITTLGVIVGIYATTGSKTAVIGGILTVAVADSFSDALGIHISQEADKEQSNNNIWAATISTFVSKLLFAALFTIPFVTFELVQATAISIAGGAVVLSVFSLAIAKKRNQDAGKTIAEHLLIGAAVVIITNLLGQWIKNTF